MRGDGVEIGGGKKNSKKGRPQRAMRGGQRRSIEYKKEKRDGGAHRGEGGENISFGKAP